MIIICCEYVKSENNEQYYEETLKILQEIDNNLTKENIVTNYIIKFLKESLKKKDKNNLGTIIGLLENKSKEEKNEENKKIIDKIIKQIRLDCAFKCQKNNTQTCEEIIIEYLNTKKDQSTHTEAINKLGNKENNYNNYDLQEINFLLKQQKDRLNFTKIIELFQSTKVNNDIINIISYIHRILFNNQSSNYKIYKIQQEYILSSVDPRDNTYNKDTHTVCTITGNIEIKIDYNNTPENFLTELFKLEKIYNIANNTDTELTIHFTKKCNNDKLQLGILSKNENNNKITYSLQIDNKKTRITHNNNLYNEIKGNSILIRDTNEYTLEYMHDTELSYFSQIIKIINDIKNKDVQLEFINLIRKLNKPSILCQKKQETLSEWFTRMQDLKYKDISNTWVIEIFKNQLINTLEELYYLYNLLKLYNNEEQIHTIYESVANLMTTMDEANNSKRFNTPICYVLYNNDIKIEQIGNDQGTVTKPLEDNVYYHWDSGKEDPIQECDIEQLYQDNIKQKYQNYTSKNISMKNIIIIIIIIIAIICIDNYNSYEEENINNQENNYEKEIDLNNSTDISDKKIISQDYKNDNQSNKNAISSN